MEKVEQPMDFLPNEVFLGEVLESPVYKTAREFAVRKHAETNHYYDGFNYEKHLDMAWGFAIQFIYLLPRSVWADVLAAVWCHDVIEDCRVSYNDLKKITNERVAELVFAVTNEKGRTRAERAGARYYAGILDTPYAPFVKLCDRLANVQYTASKGGSRMLEVYAAEQPKFEEWLLPTVAEYKPMWDMLNTLLGLPNK